MKKSLPDKLKFLLDANLSRLIIPELTEKLGFDFKHLSEFASTTILDTQVIEIAQAQQHIIITHDLDYGEIHYLKQPNIFGVIMLRLKDQTSIYVVAKLVELFKRDLTTYDLTKSLVIITENQIRISS